MYDDDLIERVARAICKADGRDDYSQWERELRPIAIAAIKAMDAWSAMIVALEKDKADVG